MYETLQGCMRVDLEFIMLIHTLRVILYFHVFCVLLQCERANV